MTRRAPEVSADHLHWAEAAWLTLAALLPRASNTPMSVLIAAYSDAAMTNMLGYVYYAPTYGFLGITAVSPLSVGQPVATLIH
jgi:hypothetical protein